MRPAYSATDPDRDYANGDFIAGAAEYPARWTAEAARFRGEMGARADLGLAYGPGGRQVLDLFHPRGEARGAVVFVHGGYWKAFDRSLWSHLAAGPLERGFAVAMPSYTLAPDVRIGAMTAEIAEACRMVAARVAGPMVVTGHSAGGHLSARMGCADSNELRLSANRALAKCTSARGTNFARARLSEANFAGADLRGAKFDDARLESAELTDALLAGAYFFRASLDKADITGGVQAQGANFLLASMQGADLSGAHLQNATLSNAALQGAVLSLAQLQGAILQDADLEAASLHLARLEGADLSGARITGADFRGAHIWMTKPPLADATGVADFSELVMRPLDEASVGMLTRVVDRIEEARQRSDVADALRPISAIAESRSWGTSAELQRWQALQSGSQGTSSETYRSRLTDYLSGAVCSRKWSNGAAATGVMRRALGRTFRGDVVALHDRLRAEGCPASKTVSSKIFRDFSSYVDVARTN